MNWQAVASSADGTKLIAANANGSIWTSTNSGNNWTQSIAPNYNWTGVASSADGMKLAAVSLNSQYGSYSGLIYTSINSGLTWAATGATPNSWLCVCSSSDGVKLAAGNENQSMDFSTNSGVSWNPVSIIDGVYCLSIACSADGSKIISTDSYISTSNDSGATWSQGSAPNGQVWSAVASSSDGNDLIAVAPPAPMPGGASASGGVCTSTNSGTNWTSNYNISPSSVASSSDGTKLVAAVNGGHIYFSTNSGKVWDHSGPIASWSAVASSADGAKLVAVVNGGGIWTAQSSPHPSINITLTNACLQLSWLLPSMDFQLQSSYDLINWSTITNTPVLNLINLKNNLLLQNSNGNCFYRLKSP